MSANKREFFRNRMFGGDKKIIVSAEPAKTENKDNGREVDPEDFEDFPVIQDSIIEEDKYENKTVKKPEPEWESTVEVPDRRDSSRTVFKEIYIEMIIDGTYSFSKVFPAVYYSIRKMTDEIRAFRTQYKSVIVKYGLIVLNETPKAVKFDNAYFTEDTKKFLEKIRSIVFTGGSESGRENINDAVKSGIRILNNFSPDKANRGLIVITDSLPESDELCPDFRDIDECDNKGLRFATFYMNGEAVYMPALKMVDSDGDETDNGKNVMNIYNLESLLDEDGGQSIQRVVKEIMAQVSVNI